ncbi:hypothetical protein [Ichthyobacterium seriolicida]|uniref:Uncharacterized protein n=1 Tax=Ichthyobacterium seriolicida TaxID=242600 RepID=A0A1J1E9Y9_9FLAO|nr:hypothetical protein [Ichthyobacterium seriolicida]BAV94336.1 hypothetical protein JBKA6_0323 [Ichthyobacterium seriolicida]
MIIAKLLSLEWAKIKYRKFNLVFFCFYFLSMLLVFVIHDKLEQGAPGNEIPLSFSGIYSTENVIQNSFYVGDFFSVFMAMLFIISITSEFSFRTFRQNIIDGLSIREFIASKLLFILVLSIVSMIIISFIGLYLGYTYNENFFRDLAYSDIQFPLAYILQIMSYMSVAMFISILVKKTGFAIICMVVASILEFSMKKLFYMYFDVKEICILPLEVFNSLIQGPLLKPELRSGFLMSNLDYVPFTGVMLSVFYFILFVYSSYLILEERDFQ